MKCVECGQIIPDESVFCPYCGKKFETQKTDIAINKKLRWPIAVLVLCIILTGGMVIGIISFYMPLVKENLQLNNKIKTAENDVENLKADISSKDIMINDLNEQLEKTQKDLENNKSYKEDYKERYNNIKDSGQNYEEMISILSNASTSNGIISVSSKIYCVKKGETLTIKVDWPSYEVTQCVGVDDYSVVDVTWENNNLAIKGINQGVTELSFSSDQSGTQDSFSVAIICY